MDDAQTFGATDTRVSSERAHLERIAAALGCPVAALYTGEGLPAHLSDRQELLSLWGALKTDASRRAVLDLVRAVVAAE